MVEKIEHKIVTYADVSGECGFTPGPRRPRPALNPIGDEVKLTPTQAEVLALLSNGWTLIGPASFAHRALASPPVRKGRYVHREYLPVSMFGTLATLAGKGLIRWVGWRNERVKLTRKGRAALAPPAAQGEGKP